MKNLLILTGVFCFYSCNAQIQEKLKGCWLPEKYVSAVIANDADNLDEYLFPVEGFEIAKEKTTEFINNYSIETDNPENLIVIKTYKSEPNTILTERVIHEGQEKYRLPYFFGGLNMKYISMETVDWYEKADVYISKSGNKLLFEAIGEGKHEKIYFIGGVNDYRFKDIQSAKKYLQTTTFEKANIIKEFTGTGSKVEELPITGVATFLNLSYEFYKEADQLTVTDQDGKELFATEMTATNGRRTKEIPLRGVTKLVFKVTSSDVSSKWKVKAEIK